MTALLLAFAFLAGLTLGTLLTVRLIPRIVARLDDTERAAFARQVADRRR